MTERPVRVLVVEDSLTVRKRLVEILSGDPRFVVAGEAEDGRRAIEMCRTLRPDVITMDMAMPVLSGLAATEYIMAYCPAPIVIVSASFNRGDLFRTCDALAAGAVDVVEKPNGDGLDAEWEHRFLSTLRLASRIRVVTHPRAKLAPAPTVATAAAPSRLEPGRCALAAIGASTGGPAAITEVLKGLPATFSLPVLVVLHIGEAFGAAFATWLDAQTSISVAHAVDREPLPGPGVARVILAPPDRHLILDGGLLRLTDAPPRHHCRPSVDVLFESIAAGGEARRTVACLLTGMGRDGARGLLALRNAGAITIAQDEETSVVYGMPREAALLGAAAEVLPLDRISGTLAAAGAPARRRA